MTLADALLGQTAAVRPGPLPLASMIAANPVGTERVADQSLTMPSPYFNPGAVVDGQPVMQTDLDAAHAQRMAGADLAKTMVMGMAGGIKAYHGSPYDFERFDPSKIGTGEGAQAYGHGLYFAGNEAVARSYRDKLSPWSPLQPTDASALNAVPASDRLAAHIDSVIAQFPGASSREIIDQVRHSYPGVVPANLEGVVKTTMASAKPTGRMYEVNLNVEPQQLLDWDKPLGEQSLSVLSALATNRTLRATPTGLNSDMTRSATLGHFVGPSTPVSNIARSPQQTTALAQAGIPGIQYLDQGSRAAGEGSRNYVMFDPNLIDIIRKYGIAGVLGGGAAAATQGTPQQ